MALFRKDIRLALWSGLALAAVGCTYVGVLLFAGGADPEAIEPRGAGKPVVRPDPLAAATPPVASPAQPRPLQTQVTRTTSPAKPAPPDDAWPDDLQVTHMPARDASRSTLTPEVAAPVAEAPIATPAWRTAEFRPQQSPAEPADRVFDQAARTHTVVAGDTFVTIAEQFYGDANLFDVIARANPGIDPRRLRIGDTVTVPAREAASQVATSAGPQTHTVRPGQTLSDIAAERLGRAVLWEQIYTLNRDAIGTDPGALKVGMVLRLPG